MTLLGRKRHPSATPRRLVDRLDDVGARRIAVLGLHPRAGTRTVVRRLCLERRQAGLSIGVISTPRADLPDEMIHEPESRIELPPGVDYASDAAPLDNEALEVVGMEDDEALGGPVWFCRTTASFEASPTLRRGPEHIARIATRMSVRAGGPVLVDGGWADREFASPDRVEGWILSAGAGFSEGIERVASAVLYRVECMRTPETDAETKAIWCENALTGRYGVVTGGAAPEEARTPDAVVRVLQSGPVDARVLVPNRLGDDLLAPLARHGLACRLILADATRLNVSPVYLKSWQKAGGRMEVAREGRVLAVTTNPINVTGPDVDAEDLRDRVRSAIGSTAPVHDVELEAPAPKRRWSLFGR